MATSEIEIIPTPPTSIELEPGQEEKRSFTGRAPPRRRGDGAVEPGQEEKRSFTVESLAAQCRILEIRIRGGIHRHVTGCDERR